MQVTAPDLALIADIAIVCLYVAFLRSLSFNTYTHARTHARTFLLLLFPAMHKVFPLSP